MLHEKLKRAHTWRRIFYERLSEPIIHLNGISLFLAAFGSYRTKILFDLIPRQHYAYGVLRAAELAANSGLKAVTIVECGVAEGTGLMNLCRIFYRDLPSFLARTACRSSTSQGSLLLLLGIIWKAMLFPSTDIRTKRVTRSSPPNLATSARFAARVDQSQNEYDSLGPPLSPRR